MAGPGAGARESVVDDGSVPVEVRGILGRFSVREAGTRDVVRVLARNRLLVPLLEVDPDQLEGDDADPCAGQDRAMAAVSLRVEDGSLGLAFSGMEALRAWRDDARPMPFPATEVAAALVQEGAVGLIVDPAGPAPCRLPPLALARLATGGAWPDPWNDPAVRQSIAAELAPVVASGEVQVRLAAPSGGEPGPAEPAEGVVSSRDRLAEAPAAAGGGTVVGLVVEIRFRADLPAEVASKRAGVIAERLAGSELLRQAFDGVLAVRVL